MLVNSCKTKVPQALSALAAGLLSLAAAAPAGRVLGEVTAIDGAGGSLTLKDQDGRSVAVKTGAETTYLKAKPGATSLEGALAVTLAEVTVGDRVLARGTASDDGLTLTARQLIVMTRGDIASKQTKEQEDWRTRGTAGVITALDPEKGEITVEVRQGGAPQAVVVSTAEKKATLRRYAPDSVKFADAKAGTFADLQVGDQLRALGDRSEDGSRFAAEQVVSGAFRTVVAAVEGVDAAKNEIRIADGASGAKLTVSVGNDAVLRRLPPEMAARMAGPRGSGGPGGPSGGRQGAPGEARPQRDATAVERPAGDRPAGAEGEGRPRGGPGGGGFGGGRRGGPPNLGDLLERMPPLVIADLKPGDRIAISSTRGADPSRITAIALVAGIEPLLATPEAGSRRQGIDLMPGLPGGALDMGMGGP